jgi:RNA polymerase sigma-70 factor (ECF subfamily)
MKDGDSMSGKAQAAAELVASDKQALRAGMASATDAARSRSQRTPPRKLSPRPVDDEHNLVGGRRRRATAFWFTGPDEILAALRAGDEQTFSELVRRYHGSLLRLARKYVPTASAAEEVVQDTWLAVLDGVDRFRGESSVEHWIFRILVKRAMTLGARERRTLPLSALSQEEAEEGSTAGPDRFSADVIRWTHPRPFELPHDRVALLELRGQLREAFAGLSERQRIVVGLRDVVGLPAEEVCGILDLTSENQRVLLHRGRARLKATLAPYALDAQDGRAT